MVTGGLLGRIFDGFEGKVNQVSFNSFRMRKGDAIGYYAVSHISLKKIIQNVWYFETKLYKKVSKLHPGMG